MANADRGAVRRWPWLETGQRAAASDTGMQIFRDVGDDSPRPVVLAGVDGAIVYANHTFHELNGDDAHQITRGGMAALSGMSPGAVEDVWRGLANGEPWTKQLNSRNRRAKNCLCCSSISPLKNAQGRVTHVLGCHVDCGDHDAATNALRAAERGARVSGVGDAEFATVVDRDERIVYNRRAQPGLSNTDVVGGSFRRYFPPEQVDVCAKRVAEVLRIGSADSYHVLATGANDDISHYETRIWALASGSQIIAAILLNHEVLAQDLDRGRGAINSAARPKRKLAAPCPSTRELEVLKLVADGLSNHEIAHSLGIRKRTVDHHVAHILTKLGAPNRTSAVLLAMTAGLIDPP